MCGLGVAVGCKSGHKKRLMCGAGWLLAAGWRGVAVGCRVKFGDFRAGKRQTLLMWLDGCKIGLTVESEEVLRFLRVWRVLSVWRLWSVLRVWRERAGKRQTWMPIRSQ